MHNEYLFCFYWFNNVNIANLCHKTKWINYHLRLGVVTHGSGSAKEWYGENTDIGGNRDFGGNGTNFELIIRFGIFT